ncbi:BTAD domain-containing putative transcriptional regulator [Actinomycetospora lutea]|uniref:BTAD domain-containing putative transcriptional regulator n=1 Tax=Actinomycetospora lutea TaxID=663604 RepID=UPI002365FABF|nr:BTAD domain-containing putative transcriptional regulator [Actinomycetospora lutea]MDD7939823.1 BTAD domain-containing putative transcriptional regulator [Actinomycetospora lutea]
MPQVHLQLLGRFQVRREGDEVPPTAFGGRKVRALLRVLAVRRPNLVPHDVLVEALWPDRPPADPVANLNVLVNRARRAVGDPAVIITGTSGYALGSVSCDLDEFEAAVREARRACDAAAVLRAATTALALWGEPLVEDTYSDWAREFRERLRRERLEVCELAAEAALAVGDARAATAVAIEAVTAEPLREQAVHLLARAYDAAGDRAAALDTIARFRGRLADELGLDPSSSLDDLQAALLRGDPHSVPAEGPYTAATFEGLPFTGRDREIVALRRGVAERAVLVVPGSAGSGKSRLVAEALRGSAVPVVAVRAFASERAESWALARSVLGEAAALDLTVIERLPPRMRDVLGWLLPETATETPTPADGESRRALLLATALRVLEGVVGDGTALVIDDLQWADPSSITLLASALARLPSLAAVLTYRPDELDPTVLTEITGDRVVTMLPLGALPPGAIEGLVDDPELALALRTSTDGTPFAIVEVLRELTVRGVLHTPDAARLAALLGREGQRRAIVRRVNRLGTARYALLALVALLKREAPARTLAAATDSDPLTTLSELSEVAHVGLLRLGELGWAPAHDLVGEAVDVELEPGERAHLHGQLAAALEAEGADDAEIAAHHRDAGDVVAAARAYGRASRQALDQHALREAGELATAGLVLHPKRAVRAELLDVRAETRAALGDLDGALTDLHDALAENAPGRAHRMARLAMHTSGARDLRRAGELVELALVEAGDEPGERAVALETAAILDMNLEHTDRARIRADEALELYRQLGDGRGVARILDGRAMATFLDGRVRDGVALFARVAQLFTDSGDLLRVITPRSTCGHGLVFADRPAEGRAQADAALLLARELGSPEGQAYALWHRSEAYSALGLPDEAEADALEALRLARDAGHRGWTATALRALGIAQQTRRHLDAAAVAFAESAAVAGDALSLFASWAAARSALVAVAQGRLDDAEANVRLALRTGPRLGQHEARWARIELAAARGDPRCAAWAADTARAAEECGATAMARRIGELAAL